MYTDFYNLKEKPFNLTPSPRYLYLGDIHKEALALLTYGVVERKGFILLTGEVGTGKTTMVQALLSKIDEKVHYVYLSNPLLTTAEFMDYLAFSTFKKKIHFKSKAEFLIEFETFLKGCLQQQENFILLIDEAHKLSSELLEEVRLLSNLETADEKLVNIFLVGQPELNEKLSQPDCRALLQRISVRYHIKPLSLVETRDYIKNRIRIAGAANGQKIFPGSTVKTIHKYSRGFPRMINVLCDNAMLLGYSREKRTITPSMMTECHHELKLDTVPTPEPIKEKAEDQQEPTGRSSWRKYAKLLLLLILAFMVGMLITGKGFDLYHQVFPVPAVVESLESSENPPAHSGKISEPEQIEIAQVSRQNVDVQESEKTYTEPTSNVVKKEVAEPSVSPPAPGQTPPSTTATVKDGDTVTGMAFRIYGIVNDEIVERIKEGNPGIEDINRIRVGQKIVFPPLEGKKKKQTYMVHIASFTSIESARELFRKVSNQGLEAYILPFYDPKKGNVFRIMLGNFSNNEQADAYAKKILEQGTADYATPVQVEVK